MMVTHNLEEGLELSTRVAIMVEGGGSWRIGPPRADRPRSRRSTASKVEAWTS